MFGWNIVKFNPSRNRTKIVIGGWGFGPFRFGAHKYIINKYDFATRKKLMSLIDDAQKFADKENPSVEDFVQACEIIRTITDEFLGKPGAYDEIMGAYKNDLGSAVLLLKKLNVEMHKLNAGLFLAKGEEYAVRKSKVDKG